MTERKVNNELMNRIGFSKPEEIDKLRKEYNKIIKIIRNEEDEKDFFYSVIAWWCDGNAPYYDTYLQRNWS